MAVSVWASARSSVKFEIAFAVCIAQIVRVVRSRRWIRRIFAVELAILSVQMMRRYGAIVEVIVKASESYGLIKRVTIELVLYETNE